MDRETRNKSGILLFLKYVSVVVFACLANLPPNSTLAQNYPSTQVTKGYRDFNFGDDVIDTPTAEKPQSKLWWHDGSWWGCLIDPNSDSYRIFLFDVKTQSWTNTGTKIDDRRYALVDALWDGSKLYVVSHITQNNNDPALLFRYSYSFSNRRYSLDNGFPVEVNDERSEALVLTKDSTGQLWVTWEDDGDIMINCSQGDDRTWGEPFRLPVQGNDVEGDDISSVISFNGDRIGVMWSNQDDHKMYFAVHLDNKGDKDWQSREIAFGDPNYDQPADDHINLKTTRDGSVYAVTKTGNTDDDDFHMFLHRRELNGHWSHWGFAEEEDGHTRPIVLIDEDHQRVYIFARSDDGSPGVIYVKSADLKNPVFPAGVGDVFIKSSQDTDINNVTSTKQNINGQTGILVLGSDETRHTYLHNFIDLGGGSSNIPPRAVASADPLQGAAPLTVAFSSEGSEDPDGSIVKYQWQFGDGASSSQPNPAHVYADGGAFTATLTVTDNEGASVSASVTIQTDAEPPTVPENLTARPVSGNLMELDWFAATDNSDVEGYHVYRDDEMIADVTATSFSDGDLEASRTYCYSVTAVDEYGLESGKSQQVCTATLAEGAFNSFADSESSIEASRSGTYRDTYLRDGISETLREQESSGASSRRYSLLDHIWRFDVHGGKSIKFFLNAYKDENDEGDDFLFAWSEDDENYFDMVTVTRTEPDTSFQTFKLPPTISGRIYVRVTDTDRTRGNRSRDRVHVDQMFIHSKPTPEQDTEAPAIPENLNAEVNGEHEIELTWDTATDNVGVAYYMIYRDGDFLVSSGGTSYRDKNLQAGLEYCYRVSAVDSSGNESDLSKSVCATTAKFLTLHVDDFRIEYASLALLHRYQPVVKIIDENGAPVNEAQVYGEWSGAASGDESAQTNEGGSASFPAFSTFSTDAVTFCVTDVVCAGYNFDIAASGDLCLTAQLGPAPNVTDVGAPPPALPEELSLQQNYPNPFNPETVIPFQLPVATRVELRIFNVLGQEIRRLVSGEMAPGFHSVTWDGKDQRGHVVNSGIYFYQLQAGDFKEIRRMNLVR